MLTPVEIYLPVLSAGILLTGGLFFALAGWELKLPVFKLGSLLLGVGFLHASLDAATTAAGPILGYPGVALQLYRLEQLFLAWLLPASLLFLGHLISVPPRARRFHRWMEWLTAAFAILLTLSAFLLPELFVSVERESFLASELQSFVGHGALGPLFSARNIALGIVLLYVLVVVFWVSASSSYRLRQSAWLAGSLVAGVIVGIVELMEYFPGGAPTPEAVDGLDASLLALSLFSLGAMIDTVRSFLGKVKVVERTRRALSEKQKALEEYLFSDLPTGLPNREAFYRDLEARLELGEEQCKAGVVFMDVDDFQGLNESLGTATVDRLIVQVARIVRSMESSAVTAYRTGTDEFALLIEGAASNEGPMAMAKEIQDSLLEGFPVEGKRHSCSISTGIVMVPEDGGDIQTISKNGYSAVRRAKQQKNAIVAYDESMRLEAEQRMRLVSDLRRSLGEREFFMVYQPLVDQTGAVSGGEALLRWRHPGGVDISPGRFVPAAESAGLMRQLGNRALELLVSDMRRLASRGASWELSLNLSAQQFAEPEFCKRLAGNLGESGYPLDRIVLEITESALVERLNRVIAGLDYLHTLGLRIAVDDFGTGYSSLSYLRDLPVDRLKVDRNFLERIPGDHRSMALLRVVRETCTLFGLEMVVEGVERPEQLAALREISSDYYQGYLFGYPGSLDALGSLSGAPGSLR